MSIQVKNNLNLKFFGQPDDEVLLTTDGRFRHYKANEDCIILKDGLLFRKQYGVNGSVKYYYILISEHLVNEELRSVHGKSRKHPGITHQ